MVVEDDDEVLVVMESGNVVRSAVEGVPSKGRDTMGVIFAKPRKKDRIIKVARSSGAVLAATGEADGENDGDAAEDGNDAVTADGAPSEPEGADQADAVALDSDQASTEQAPESDESDGGHQ